MNQSTAFTAFAEALFKRTAAEEKFKAAEKGKREISAELDEAETQLAQLDEERKSTASTAQTAQGNYEELAEECLKNLDTLFQMAPKYPRYLENLGWINEHVTCLLQSIMLADKVRYALVNVLDASRLAEVKKGEAHQAGYNAYALSAAIESVCAKAKYVSDCASNLPGEQYEKDILAALGRLSELSTEMESELKTLSRAIEAVDDVRKCRSELEVVIEEYCALAKGAKSSSDFLNKARTFLEAANFTMSEAQRSPLENEIKQAKCTAVTARFLHKQMLDKVYELRQSKQTSAVKTAPAVSVANQPKSRRNSAGKKTGGRKSRRGK